MLAAEGDDRTDGHARRLHVDQEEADAFLDFPGGVGADEEEAPVGVLGHGGPGLLAVDDIEVAVPLGLGLEVREVGACARLGIALAPPDVARQRGGQELLLLLRRAEGVDHRTDHVDAEGQDRHRVGGRALFGPDVALHRRPARTAVFGRPCGRHPALVRQDPVPGEEVFLAHLFAFFLHGAKARRIVLGDEGAHFGAEGVVFRRKVEVHRSSAPSGVADLGGQGATIRRPAPPARVCAK